MQPCNHSLLEWMMFGSRLELVIDMWSLTAYHQLKCVENAKETIMARFGH